MLNRHFSGAGIRPFFGYLLSLIAFIGLSTYLFYKTQYAAYIYAFVSFSFLTKLSEINRNDFLKSCFSIKHYFQIRLLENIITILPFLIFLLYQGNMLVALALLLGTVILAFINLDNKLNITIPTPFSRQPFEFVIGFRKTFFVFIIAYFITYMSITVGNFNLGIFSLLLVFLTCLSYYTNPEDEFYVWIFASNSKQFLLNKIKTSLLFSSVLSLPIALGLGIFFPDNIKFILIFLGLGYIYLLTILLAKYAAFPEKVNLPQGILIAFGIWLPPLLIGIIPFFYVQSIKRLNEILE